MHWIVFEAKIGRNEKYNKEVIEIKLSHIGVFTDC